MLGRIPAIISVSSRNYLSAIQLQKVRSTKRGRVGADTGAYPHKDVISNLAVTSSDDDGILLFTNIGKAYRFNLDDEKAIVISENLSWSSEPTNIPALLETNTSSFEKGEKVVQIVPIKDSEFEEGLFLFMITEQGLVKKIELSQLESITRAGKRVITLFEGDDLSRVIKIGADEEILVGTSNGYALRFSSSSVRASGRNASGVKSIELDPKSGAKIISLSSTSNSSEALVISIDEEGKGKCTSLQEFRLTSRRSRGTISYKLGFSTNTSKLKKIVKSTKKLSLIACSIVHDDEEIILLSDHNKINRIGVDQVVIRNGRNTAGTILVRLEESGEKLAHFTKCSVSGT